MSSKEINQLITNSQLKIIYRCENMVNYQNGHVLCLSNVKHIYYMRLLDNAYDKLFSEN